MSRYTITAYADGFTLPIDDYLTISGAGTIGGAGLTAENRSTTVNDGAIHPLMGQAAYGYGGNGGNGVNGVTLTTATLTNNGTVVGGAAAAGGVGPTSYYYGAGYGGAGGAAGIGVSGSGSIANYGAIFGGAGGAGGQGGFALISDSSESGGYGGQAGAGGAAVNLKTGTVVNEGFFLGGQGGAGGAGASASGSDYAVGGLGAGGAAGGAGAIMNGGSFANFQYAFGGDGGNGGAGGGAGANTAAFGGNGGNGGAGGTAVALTGVTAYLSGYIIAGYGGTGGAGGIATGSSHDPTRALAGVGGAGGVGGSGLVVTGESVTSSADIYGGAGGGGGLGGAAGAYRYAYGGAGGLGGTGGAGLVVTRGTFNNDEGVVGGAGGTGGSGGVAGGPGSKAVGGASGNGGTGGAGVVLAGGLVTNFDVIYGGAGGKGGTGQGAFDQYTAVGSSGVNGYAGNGVDVTDGGTVINYGTISGNYGVADTGHGAVTVINSGTINGGVQFESANDKFVVDEGSKVYGGLMDGGGGTMAFNGSSGDFNYLNRAGTGEFYGGAFGIPFDFGTYSFYGGAKWTLTGMAVINPTQTLDIADATVSIQSLGVGQDTPFFDGGKTSLGVGGVIAGYGGAYFYNYGVLTGGGAIYGSMVVTNDPGGTIDNNAGSMLIDNQHGGGLDNAGVVESTATGSLGLKDVAISGAGTIVSKALIKLEDATIEAGTVIVSVGGELDVVSSASTITAGVTVTNSGLMRIDAGAPLTLESNLKNMGTIDIDGTGVAQAYLSVVGNVTLSGSGAVSLNAFGAISGYGATDFTNFDTITGGQTIFGSMTVVNHGVIDDDSGVMLVNNQFGGGWTNVGTIESTNTGQLELKDIILTGAGSISDGHQLKLTSATIKAGTLTVKAGALLEVTGGSNTIAAAVDLTNDQTVEAISGGLTIAGAIDNTGVIETAQTGSIAIDGAVTGSGSVKIAGSGSLTLDGACAQEVTFASGATGRLVLGAASDFTGMIAGLSKTGANAIDLQGVTYKSTDKAVFSGGVLSIETSGGTVLATLDLTGNYNGQTFTLANDGSGHTLVTDPPASGPLAQAMASMTPTTPATAMPVLRSTTLLSAPLASPHSG